MDIVENNWYKEGKNYLIIEKQGIDLLKEYLVNSEKLFQSEIYRHELPYVIMMQLGNRINEITLMVFDENNEELFIMLGDEQLKFSLQEDGLYLNDLMIDTKSIHIPSFEEEKIFMKK